MTQVRPAGYPVPADTLEGEHVHEPRRSGGDDPATVLADLDARVRSLTSTRRVTGADVRHARREARRVLRESRPAAPIPGTDSTDDVASEPASTPVAMVGSGLGVCESCRQVPAVQRVVFADLAVFAVCTPCAAGALGVAA